MRKLVFASCLLLLLLWTVWPTPLSGKTEEPPPSFSKPAPLVLASNEFTLDLYRSLGTQPGNFVFSGFNVSTALSMAHAGARGETASQMEKVLHLPPDPDLDKNLGKLLKTLRSRPDVKLELANALWGQKGYPFQKDYLEGLRRNYDSPLNEVDFIRNPDGVKESVRKWVDKNTSHLIPRFVTPVDQTTRFVITTAIYFKGEWLTRFDKGLTRDEDFCISPGKSVKLPMMHGKEGDFALADTDLCRAIALPYKGQKLAMVVLLPKDANDPDGLTKLEKALEAQKLTDTLCALQFIHGQIVMPKFSIQDGFDLKDTLSALGMDRAFDPVRADFTGIAQPVQPLFIQFVRHDAVIIVDEKGTEAAAATSIGFCAGQAITPPIVIDRPFIYAIVDVPTGTILFMGRFKGPQA